MNRCNENSWIPPSARRTYGTYTKATFIWAMWQPFVQLDNMSARLMKLSFLVLLHSFIHSIQYDQTSKHTFTPCMSVHIPLSQSECTVPDRTAACLRRVRLLTLVSEKIPTQAWYSSSRPASLWEWDSYRSHTSHCHLLSLSSAYQIFLLFLSLPQFNICPFPLLSCLLFEPLSQITHDSGPNIVESDECPIHAVLGLKCSHCTWQSVISKWWVIHTVGCA